jgi:hypothetical protein
MALATTAIAAGAPARSTFLVAQHSETERYNASSKSPTLLTEIESRKRDQPPTPQSTDAPHSERPSPTNSGEPKDNKPFAPQQRGESEVNLESKVGERGSHSADVLHFFKLSYLYDYTYQTPTGDNYTAAPPWIPLA